MTRKTRIRTALVSLAVSVTAFAGLAGAAGAATPTKVIIKAESGGFYGYVKSADTDCAAERKVVLYEQLGNKQSPQTDQKIGSDTSSSLGTGLGSVGAGIGIGYMWSTGNTGTHEGLYYARATRIPGCKPANSKTIPAQA